MWDLAPMSIFINHPLYVSYSSLPNMGSGCYNESLNTAKKMIWEQPIQPQYECKSFSFYEEVGMKHRMSEI
jgi:hypothetical protein